MSFFKNSQSVIPTPNAAAGKKVLPSVSSITGSQMSLPFGLTWIHLLVGAVVVFVVWKYVLKK
jgi:hypothetical protein